MRSATQVTISTMGVLAGLASIEHGIGEILQGNIAPDGIVIESWPNSALFRVVAGEPAMTLIPNLLISGVVACLVSVLVLVWTTLFVQRKNGGLVLILLSLVLLLVGGGFGPPLLGLTVSAVWIRSNAPFTWWRAHLSLGIRRFLAKLWPWSLLACLLAWLLLFPGSLILGHFFGIDNPNLVPILFFLAIGLLLLLAIPTGFAHDIQSQTGSAQAIDNPYTTG